MSRLILRPVGIPLVTRTIGSVGPVGTTITIVAVRIHPARFCSSVRSIVPVIVFAISVASIIIPVGSYTWIGVSIVPVVVVPVVIIAGIIATIISAVIPGSYSRSGMINIVVPIVTVIISIIIVYNQGIVSVSIIAIVTIAGCAISRAINRRSPPATMPVIPGAIVTISHIKPACTVTKTD